MTKLKKWELLEEEDVSPSKWFPLFRHKVKLSNGKIVDDYYISKLGDVAMIFAVTKNNEVVFVRQYKHGAGEIIIELPAGRIKPGNTSEEEAKIELREETGYVAEVVEPLGEFFFEPSKDTLKVFAYLVRDVEVQLSQQLEETEDIEVLLIPAKEIDQKIVSGEIAASDTLAVIKLAQIAAPEIFG